MEGEIVQFGFLLKTRVKDVIYPSSLKTVARSFLELHPLQTECQESISLLQNLNPENLVFKPEKKNKKISRR